MKTVPIQGALGGIGDAFVRALLRRPDVDRVVATARDSELRPELLATPEAHPEGVLDMSPAAPNLLIARTPDRDRPRAHRGAPPHECWNPP